MTRNTYQTQSLLKNPVSEKSLSTTNLPSINPSGPSGVARNPRGVSKRRIIKASETGFAQKNKNII